MIHPARRALSALVPLLLAAVAGAQEPPPPPADGKTERPAPGTEAPPPPAPATDKPAPEKPPAPAPAGAAGVDHFPLDAARRWSYSLKYTIEPTAGKPDEREDTEHALDCYVAEPQTLGGQLVHVLEWKLDGELAQRCYFTVDQGKVHCVKRIHGFGEHMKEFVLDPPQENVRTGMTIGTDWVWQGKAGPAAGKQTFRVVRQERVELPAGTYDALVLEATFEGEDDTRGTTLRWLAAGVGIVREVSEVRTANAVFRTEAKLTRVEGAPR